MLRRITTASVGIGLATACWSGVAHADESRWYLKSVAFGITASEASSDIVISGRQFNVVTQAFGLRVAAESGPLRWGGRVDLLGRTRKLVDAKVSRQTTTFAVGTNLLQHARHALFLDLGIGGSSIAVERKPRSAADEEVSAESTFVEVSMGFDHALEALAISRRARLWSLVGVRVGYRQQVARGEREDLTVEASGGFIEFTIGMVNQ